MSRCLKLVASFTTLSLILKAVILNKDGLPDWLISLLAEARDVSRWIVVGGLLLWVIEEHLERHIAPAIRSGLSDFARAVAEGVRSQLSPGAKTMETLGDIFQGFYREHVKTPEVRRLAEEGKFQEAATKAPETEEQIAVLIKSENSRDWDEAFRLVRKLTVPSPQFFVTLSYRFWNISNIPRAREIAERGLKVAEGQKDSEYVAKLKNTLAYLYAESHDKEKEELARRFASESFDGDVAQRLDTNAYVKIIFAKKSDDVIDALGLNERAREKGLPLEDYAKNVRIAEERIQDLKRDSQTRKAT